MSEQESALSSTDTKNNPTHGCVKVNLRITTNSNQGGRKYMEDAYAIALQRVNTSDKESPISLAYFGIFDGHGGTEAAEFARQNLCQHILKQDDFWSHSSDENENDQMVLSAIRKGFLACHNDMWNHVDKWAKTSSGLPSTSGCTASVVFIRGNKIYIGHVGDSAIVLGEGETLYKSWKAHRLTHDHKPEDPTELKRIRESGGNVMCKAGVHRVVWNRQKSANHSSNRHRHQHAVTTTTTTTLSGVTVEYEQIPFLAVSRALGDLWSLNPQTNLYAVSPEPELTVIEIDSNKHRCLILASDGLWNMITPETAIEIVRNCDIKTEEMILKSEDDDHRPFRNPSHELVQKAINSWRERMLRSDNITCITVMLDRPGPPFSDCIVQKKRQRLTYSTSSSTASVCSDDTVELDRLSPMSSTVTATTTNPLTPLQRTKPLLQRKEHILTPISNGPSPTRTPKRPASEDEPPATISPPSRKLLKTNQQKENGRTSSSSSSSTEATASSYLLVPISSTDTDESESNSNEETTAPDIEQPVEMNCMETEETNEDVVTKKPFLPYSRSFSIDFIPNEDERAPRGRSHSASTIEIPIQRLSRRRSSFTDFHLSNIQSSNAKPSKNPNSDDEFSASNVD